MCKRGPYSTTLTKQVDTPELSTGSDSETDRPPTPTSLTDEHDHPTMPYAIFNPEMLRGGSASVGREYNWGQANVMDPAQSDFAALRFAVIGKFATASRSMSCPVYMTNDQALKVQTKEKLYETYRTEKLMAKRSHGR